MTCDIIMEIPWHCGESDCPAGWHMSNYWIDDSSELGYTVDNYADGDHVDCEESDVPSHDEYEAAWRRYNKDVAETGADPLGQFNVKRTRPETWTVELHPKGERYEMKSGLDPDKVEWHPTMVPDQIHAWLMLEDGFHETQYRAMARQSAGRGDCKLLTDNNVLFITLDIEVARDAEDIRKDLVAAATKAGG